MYGRHREDFNGFKRWVGQYGKGVFQPRRGPPGYLDDLFDRFCEYALTLSNTMVFVDEPAMVEDIPQSFWDLHRLGHKRGLGLIIATHRLADLEAVAQQVDHLFVFRIPIVYDIWTLKSVLGDAGASWVANAPPRVFWYKGIGGSGPCPALPVAVVNSLSGGRAKAPLPA